MDCVHPILYNSKLSLKTVIKQMAIDAIPRPMLPLAHKLKRALT
jgi:hypothetical protein